MVQLAAFCAVVCKGPCGEQKGKALSEADFSLRSSQSLPLRRKTKKYKECNRTPYVFYVYINVLADV